MRKITLILTFALLATGTSLAAELVTFEDGRTLKVQDVRKDGDFAVLALEGGGEIAVPVSRISHRERIRQEIPAAAPASRTRQAPQPAMLASKQSPRAWRAMAGDFADLIGRAAARHRVDPALLTAVASVESAFDPYAVSPKGAGGLLQLMPATAKRFGVNDVFNPAQNIDGGAEYLSWLLQRFEGRTELALAGYNAGEGAVDRYDGIPPYAETRNYVARVIEGASRLGAAIR